MKASAWKPRLIKQCQDVGTYRDSFLPVIRALADILERRDAAYEEYIASGEGATIERTSDRGAVNQAKNPRLQIWVDLNNLALSYWRDLGLTPAGYKRLNPEATQAKDTGGLENLLEKLLKDDG